MIYLIILILTEEEFEKIKLGNTEVFEKIYNEYKLKLYNFLVVKSNGDTHVAEEVLSDTIYSALISAPTLKGKDKILGWLFRIANRRFADYLRKKYKDKKTVEIIQFHEELSKEEKELDEDNKAVMLQSAMEKLNPKYREVIKLKYIENKSQMEIAQIIKKSRSSVESLLFRAREALKVEVKKMYKNIEL